jgi:hypothetical protein
MNPAGLEPAACRFGGDRSQSTELRVQSERLREKDSNLHRLVQSQTSCRLDDPEMNDERGTRNDEVKAVSGQSSVVSRPWFVLLRPDARAGARKPRDDNQLTTDHGLPPVHRSSFRLHTCFPTESRGLEPLWALQPASFQDWCQTVLAYPPNWQEVDGSDE